MWSAGRIDGSYVGFLKHLRFLDRKHHQITKYPKHLLDIQNDNHQMWMTLFDHDKEPLMVITALGLQAIHHHHCHPAAVFATHLAPAPGSIPGVFFFSNIILA